MFKYIAVAASVLLVSTIGFGEVLDMVGLDAIPFIAFGDDVVQAVKSWETPDWTAIGIMFFVLWRVKRRLNNLLGFRSGPIDFTTKAFDGHNRLAKAEYKDALRVIAKLAKQGQRWTLLFPTCEPYALANMLKQNPSLDVHIRDSHESNAGAIKVQW